jgi:hypothetical protein
MTPEDVSAWLGGLRGPGGSSEAIRNQSFARSISSSRSKSSALRSAPDQDRSPSRPVDETFGITFASPANFPSVLHPEGLRFMAAHGLTMVFGAWAANGWFSSRAGGENEFDALFCVGVGGGPWWWGWLLLGVM